METTIIISEEVTHVTVWDTTTTVTIEEPTTIIQSQAEQWTAWINWAPQLELTEW